MDSVRVSEDTQEALNVLQVLPAVLFRIKREFKNL